MLKPSLIKTNARYRGPTEAAKYINMVHETLHDLTLLCYKIDGNEYNKDSIGHREAIRDNMYYYITGIAAKNIIKVPTATVLCNTETQMAEKFQSISPTTTMDRSIKTRISMLESEINFLLNNL